MTTTTGFEADYEAITQRVGVLDRSERGKLALTGTDAKEFLHGQLTQDINGLPVGQGTYAAFLTAKGRMLGDLRVLNAGDELLLDTERVALQPLFNMIRTYSLGADVELHKRTLQCGLLSLIGPLADEIIPASGAGLRPGLGLGTGPGLGLGPGPGLGMGMGLGEREHDHVALTLGDAAVRAIRTDVGIDLLFAAEDLVAVRAAVLEAGAVEVSDDAAECVRIESGRPRYGVDLDDSVIPQEAGLNARAVSFTKGCYVGQETVARLYYKGKPNRGLAGLRSGVALAAGTELTFEDRVVGTVTSTTVSPRFGPIALALVRREAPAGSVVTAGGEHQAVVVELPFG
jgi:folate-binding protein YgfZ